ncbi:sortase [Candidatus Saccharibacteria bacterium]|jgi:LPXTG-site transpeptidase (sortase) family protein|nr:sortase [Candidatus Saccharibacteria bacterium]
MKTIQPLPPDAKDEAAIRLQREKVARAYGDEPNAVETITKSQAEAAPSKHQLYMRELSASGRSLAEIQTAWHHYYTKLSDAEKHEVWQEFYSANQHTPYQKLFQKQQPVASRLGIDNQAAVVQPGGNGIPTPVSSSTGVFVGAPALSENTISPRAQRSPKKPKQPSRLAAAVRSSKTTQKVLATTAGKKAQKHLTRAKKTISANGKLNTKHHLQSLAFGLGMGGIVLAILLFSFFNEYIIAPFIQPSRKVTAAPVIMSTQTAAASAQPTVIVPKINIQIPIDFNLSATDESTVQTALEEGVIHYPSTVLPGQNGNGAYFGHSSSNIFNNGKYKFAFVLLHQLTTGDIFYITHNGKVYAYQVFAREIVPPTQVSVLHDTKGKTATAVLITCDPPGLSTNRLVVWGEQVSPNPATNTTPEPKAQTTPDKLSSNGPTLWTRIVRGVQFWKRD